MRPLGRSWRARAASFRPRAVSVGPMPRGREFRVGNDEVVATPTDATDPEAVAAIAAEPVRPFRRIDVRVGKVGAGAFGPLLDTALDLQRGVLRSTRSTRSTAPARCRTS